MVTMTVEISNDELKELFRAAMKMEALDGFLKTLENKNDPTVWVKDLRTIMNGGEK